LKRALIYSALGPGSGCALRAQYLAEALQRQGWQVRLVVPRLRNQAYSLEALAALPRFLGAAIFHRYELAVGIKPYPHVWLGLWFARLRGAKAVLDIDDLDHAWRKGPAALLMRALQAPAFWLLKRFSTHHAGIRQHLAQEQGISAARIYDLPQGVDLHRFSPFSAAQGLAFRKEQKLGPGKLLVFAAHLNVACQLERLLEKMGPLFHEKQPFTLVVAGGGPLYEKYKSAYADWPRLRFTGPLEPSQAAQWMSAADLCLAYWDEGPANAHRVPMKVMEYLAVGRPVLCNLIPGLYGMERFLYLERRDAPEYVDLLRRLLKSRGDGREKKGQQWVRSHLSWDKVAKRFLAALGWR